MNDKLAKEIREKAINFFAQEKYIDFEEEPLDHITDQAEYDRLQELCFFVHTLNTPKGIQRLVRLRNRIHNSDEIEIYEFIEEQIADQVADGNEMLVVDFYISKTPTKTSKIRNIAEEIASYLMTYYEPNEEVKLDKIDKECYEAVAIFKGEIFDEVIKVLKENNRPIEE